MQQLTWLHLSDLHFHPELGQLLAYLKRSFAKNPALLPDLIFCTGNIAFGQLAAEPMAKQYAQAALFLDALLLVCGENGVPLAKERLFVIPGNHDVNRDSVDPDAQETLKRKAEQSKDYVDEINLRFKNRQLVLQNSMRRLAEYAQFVESTLPHQHDTGERVRYAKLVEIDGLKIGIGGLNSAWSCLNQDDHALWLAAEWQLDETKTELKDAALRIALMHHPVECLNQSEQAFVVERLASDFDFFLHGHGHKPWAAPGPPFTLHAGAVGTPSANEFGINLVQLDFQEGKGRVHLHRYDKTGWVIAPQPNDAPEGVWEFDLPLKPSGVTQPAPANSVKPIKSAKPIKSTKPIESVKPIESDVSTDSDDSAESTRPQNPASPKPYGRDKLLEEAAGGLLQHSLLLVYGASGTGKTSVIEALSKLAPLADKEEYRIQVDRDTGTDGLFRQFAHMLGDKSEHPRPPDGEPDAIAQELLRRYPAPRPIWLWLERAHLLLDQDQKQFEKPELRNFLMGLNMAFRASVTIVLELRKCPQPALLGKNCGKCEVPGLNRIDMADCLADAAQATKEANWRDWNDWRYAGEQLSRIYGRVGGGGSKRAHPLAVGLLIALARGRRQTPIKVLEHLGGDDGQEIADALLDDLINNGLSEDQRQLFNALALYRGGIPHCQVKMLEKRLQLSSAWRGIARCGLLAPNNKGSLYFLHDFVSERVRGMLGYAAADADADRKSVIGGGFRDDASLQQRQYAERLHAVIADCWLEQLGSGKRKARQDAKHMLEAFFHLTAAARSERLQEIAVESLRGNEEWARHQIKQLYKYLYKNTASAGELRIALEYWLMLKPDDPKALRFLGESWVHEKGTGSAKALACFEHACQVNPEFPRHWANLGKCLMAQGVGGARDFLQRLETLQQEYPQAIDDRVRLVQTYCLFRVGQEGKGRALRMSIILTGSQDPLFYTDEAKWRQANGDANGVLEILDLAAQRGCASDLIDSLRCAAWQQTGQTAAATALRLKKIGDGSNNPEFYNNEAKARLEADDAKGAMEMLDLVTQRGHADDCTDALRADALQQSGRLSAATALRMEKILGGSRNSAYYNAEAQARLDAGNANGAMEMLDLAAERGRANSVSNKIRSNAILKLKRRSSR